MTNPWRVPGRWFLQTGNPHCRQHRKPECSTMRRGGGGVLCFFFCIDAVAGENAVGQKSNEWWARRKSTRWWQIFFGFFTPILGYGGYGANSNTFGIFTPIFGEDGSNLTSIFQMGGFNHQLDIDITCSYIQGLFQVGWNHQTNNDAQQEKLFYLLKGWTSKLSPGWNQQVRYGCFLKWWYPQIIPFS